MNAPMKPLSVVVAQSDTKAADFLVKSLYNHFRVVNKVNDLSELRNSIPRHRADVAILDLELADLKQLQRLINEFAGTSLVCTNRLADEMLLKVALAVVVGYFCHTVEVHAMDVATY